MSDVLQTRDVTPKSGVLKVAMGKSPSSLVNEGKVQPTLSSIVDNAVSAVALAEELAEVKGAVVALANPAAAASRAAIVAPSPSIKRPSRIPRLGTSS